MAKLIKLCRNLYTEATHFKVSDEDYARVNTRKWYLSVPDVCGNSYVVSQMIVSVDGKRGLIRAHRFILGVSESKVRVDHKNMNTLDNTRPNLRTCTPSLNAANKKVQRNKLSSKYKGVFKRSDCKTPTFRAMIGYENKILRIGSFKTEKEAALAYDKRAKELFGEFARLNFKEKRV